jgi:hypothetical protein
MFTFPVFILLHKLWVLEKTLYSSMHYNVYQFSQ